MFIQSKKAFTLVELLVVIAIISILAGILMPALENAIGSARTITCSANLKQMGLGVRMYLDDNNGYFFAFYDGSRTWYDNAGTTFNTLYLEVDKNPKGNLFDCPSGRNGWNGPDKEAANLKDGNMDYGYNQNLGYYSSGTIITQNEYGKFLRGNESKTAVFSDAERYHLDNTTWDDSRFTYGVQWCHLNGDGANFVFHDGHVSTLEYNEVLLRDVFQPW